MLKLLALALLASGTGEALANTIPERDVGIAMVEAAIRDTLKDPESARFEWPNGFSWGWFRRPFGRKYEGWITCGTVNAKNSYGGYVGRAAALGVISDGVVVYTDIDHSTDGYDRTFVADACQKIGVPVQP